MTATAIVNGKVVRFRLPPALAQAQRRNRGRRLTAAQAVAFVESKRRERSLRLARPYLTSYAGVGVVTPGKFVNLPAVLPLIRRLR